jgi:hypothetical protein
MEMNRIQSIKTFLEDYKSLNPYLKELKITVFGGKTRDMTKHGMRSLCRS